MKFVNLKIKKKGAPGRIEFYKGLGCGELRGSLLLMRPLISSHFQGLIVCQKSTKPQYGCQYPLILKRIEDSCGSKQNETKSIQYEQYFYHFFPPFQFSFPRFPRGKGLSIAISDNI
jgi:hypothetical protein